jgi:hypothetical protein
MRKTWDEFFMEAFTSFMTNLTDIYIYIYIYKDPRYPKIRDRAHTLTCCLLTAIKAYELYKRKFNLSV